MSSPDTLELEELPLPPIPGPISQTFFRDIPQNAPAIFSTLLGTRPLRPLPNPAPPHVDRPAGNDDIKSKAWSLIHTYPDIAQPVVTPPQVWQDLYKYFDAVDLWMEGAGFLFHVVGFIVKVNVTRLNCIQKYAGDWALTNWSRLAIMHVGEDVLSSDLTLDDRAYFDTGNLTRYEMSTLASILNCHREAVQAKQGALHVARVRESEHAPVRTWRHPHATQTNPSQHLGHPGCQLSHWPSGYIAAQQKPSGDQTRTFFNSDHRNGSVVQCYERAQEIFKEGLASVLPKRTVINTRHQPVRQDGRFEFSNDSRQGACDLHTLDSFQRQSIKFNGPVYMLNSQKPSAGVRNEVSASHGFHRARSSASYPAQRSLNGNFKGQNSQDGRGDRQSVNSTRLFSYDARLHNNKEFSQSIDSSNRSTAPWFRKENTSKDSWPQSDSDRDCTVFVGCLQEEVLKTEWVPRLLSECGEVAHFRRLLGKGCGFVTFKNPVSAAEAISRFNKYCMQDGKFLTVQYPISRDKSGTYASRDGYHNKSRDPSQISVQGNTSATYHQTGDSDLRGFRRSSTIIFPHDPPSVSLEANRYHSLSSGPRKHQGGSNEATHLDTDECAASLHHLPSRKKAALLAANHGAPPPCSFNAQLDYNGAFIRTLGCVQQCNGLEEITAPTCDDKRSVSGQSGDGRLNKSAKPKKKGKTPRRFSGSVNSTPTHTPIKKCSRTSSGDSSTTNRARNNSLISSVGISSIGSKSNWFGNSRKASDLRAIDEPPQLQSTSSSLSGCGLANTSNSTRGPYVNTEFVPATRSDVAYTLYQSSTLGATQEPNQIDLAHDTMLADAPAIKLTKFSETLEPSDRSTKPSALIVPQKKKMWANRKKARKPSKDGSSETTMDSISPSIHDMAAKTDSNGMLEAMSIPHKTNNNMILFTSASSQKTPSNIEKHDSVRHIEARSDAISTGNGSRGSHSIFQHESGLKKESLESQVNAGDDVFDDGNLASVQTPQKPKAPSLVKIDHNGSVKSSLRKADSAAKARSNNHDRSPTPAGKSKPKPKKKKDEKKIADINRKENDQPQPSPTQILSDPLQWPTLGSAKLQVETKSSTHQRMASVVRPLLECPPQPGLLRRDSIASIMSSSPQTARRLTADGASSPVSGGSKLWPVVKRWEGRPTGDKGKSASVTNSNEFNCHSMVK